MNEYYTLPIELHPLIAILQGNYTELIADVVHLKSFWHAAHLAGKKRQHSERERLTNRGLDLLCQWKDPAVVVYDKEDIRKYYIMEYMGSLPIHHAGIFPILRDYCRTWYVLIFFL